MKKIWSVPVLEELTIKETACGDDFGWYRPGGHYGSGHGGHRPGRPHPGGGGNNCFPDDPDDSFEDDLS